VPALEARQAAFQSAHTQVLGVSIDSVHSHANWAAKDLGGISFPLLADFHPKGAVAESYGLYLADKGITDRATVLIDAAGSVVFVESVTPAGERDIDALLKRCQELDAAYATKLPDSEDAKGLSGPAELFVKTGCGFSKVALLARTNLHLEEKVSLRNISESDDAKRALEALTQKTQVPCLVEAGTPLLESADIVARFRAVTGGLS